jgi:hypothetical protein
LWFYKKGWRKMSNWLLPTGLICLGLLLLALGAICLAWARGTITQSALQRISAALVLGLIVALVVVPIAWLAGWIIGQGLMTGDSWLLRQASVAQMFDEGLQRANIARSALPALMAASGAALGGGYSLGLALQRRDKAAPDAQRAVLLRLLLAGGAVIAGLLLGFFDVSGGGIPPNHIGIAINNSPQAFLLAVNQQEILFGFTDQMVMAVLSGVLGGGVIGFFSGSIIDTSIGLVTLAVWGVKDLLAKTDYIKRLFTWEYQISVRLWFYTPILFFCSIGVGFFIWAIVASWNFSDFWHAIGTLLSIILWFIGAALFTIFLLAIGVLYGLVQVATNTMQHARNLQEIAEHFDWSSCAGAIVAGVLFGYGAFVPWLHYIFFDARLGLAGIALGVVLGIFLGCLPYLKRWVANLPTPIIFAGGSIIVSSGVVLLGLALIVH